MKNQKERIESLRKAIVTKKERLGVNADLLYLKGLRKYNNLEELKYPKSLSPFKYYYIKDEKGRFNDVKYNRTIDINKNDYVFEKIVTEVTKKVMLDFNENLEGLSISERVEYVNNYIKENTYLKNVWVEVESDEKVIDYVKYSIKSYGKVDACCVVKMVDNNRPNIRYNSYSVLDITLPKKVVNKIYTGHGEYKGIRVAIHSIATYIAKAMVFKVVSEYVFKDEERKELIKNKVSQVVEFNEEEFNQLTGESMTETMEDNYGGALNFMKTLVALSMEEMLKESFEIYQYEERLESISGDYAKTYMTKKNIPKRTLAFMENNNFLNMFGYVEADEDCEIEKLENLSTELVDLSKKMFLPISKDHALRFRKLGKLKASGVYYPGYNTLAVDLDGVSSFIHEMMHMIDFTNDILSLDYKFKPLLTKYRELMDEYVLTKFGENSESYNTWHKGKSKYNRAYYASNEEAFARMGELYVTEILNVKTSFSKLEYNDDKQKIVYPKDAELLDMIKVYYDEVFATIRKNGESVTFENKKKETDKKSEKKTSNEPKKIKSDLDFMSSAVGKNVVASSNQLSFF